MAEFVKRIDTITSTDCTQNATGGDYDEWITVWKTRLGFIALHFSSAECECCELTGNYNSTVAVEVDELGLVQMSEFQYSGLCNTLDRRVEYCTLEEFDSFWKLARTIEELIVGA